MAEIRKFDHPKIAQEVNPLLQSRSARTGRIRDYRIQDRQMKKASQLSNSNPASINHHPVLKNSNSDPLNRKKPLDFKEKQCLDCRKVKESHSASKKPPFIVPGRIHHNDYFCQSVDKHLPPRYKKMKIGSGAKPVQHHSSASHHTTSSVSTASHTGSSFASKDSVFTAPTGLVLLKPVENKMSETASTADDMDLSPLGVMTPLNKRDTPENLHLSPALGSNPWITKHRGCVKIEGKENCSSESVSPPSNFDVPKICLQDKTLNESEITEECSEAKVDMETVRVAQSFREILSQEDERLKFLCHEWEQCLEDGQVPATEIGAVFTVVGQAQLLQRERFNQFAELIGQFETKTGEKEITATDLEGFWEMIYIQVSDVDRKFFHLNELRANNWIRQEEVEPEVIPKKPAGKKKIKPTPARSTGSKSNLRAHIAAARKKMNKTPLKSPSFCVRLTPPLRSPSDFRRLANKLAEESLTNQAETSQTEPLPATNCNTSGGESLTHMFASDAQIDALVDSVLKLSTRKKHNSARYFPSITPQRPGRKRSSTADPIIVGHLAKLNLFSEPLEREPLPSKPVVDQALDFSLSETPIDIGSITGIDDLTTLSTSEHEALPVRAALIREGTLYPEENNNNVETPLHQKKKLVPAPFDSLDGSLDVDTP